MQILKYCINFCSSQCVVAVVAVVAASEKSQAAARAGNCGRY